MISWLDWLTHKVPSSPLYLICVCQILGSELAVFGASLFPPTGPLFLCSGSCQHLGFFHDHVKMFASKPRFSLLPFPFFRESSQIQMFLTHVSWKHGNWNKCQFKNVKNTKGFATCGKSSCQMVIKANWQCQQAWWSWSIWLNGFNQLTLKRVLSAHNFAVFLVASKCMIFLFQSLKSLPADPGKNVFIKVDWNNIALIIRFDTLQLINKHFCKVRLIDECC